MVHFHRNVFDIVLPSCEINGRNRDLKIQEPKWLVIADGKFLSVLAHFFLHDLLVSVMFVLFNAFILTIKVLRIAERSVSPDNLKLFPCCDIQSFWQGTMSS